ncbi:unnamed protein product [Lymnaea stagnalis]|uniref:EGF-like domain-containing protein n=1 Tax=Lymnaea stagnalis TaxID=6523 RepID=A0AAV2IH25_LYMST
MFGLQYVLAVTLLTSLVHGQTTDDSALLLVGTYGECGGIKCDNYAVCKIENGRPKCYCEDGSTGVICQVVTIKRGCTLDCKNDAVCQVDADKKQKCVCPDGFYGALCQYQGTPSCSNHKCYNNGVCQVIQGIRYCDCPLGFDGPKCENINWCQRKKVVCFNSGDCMNETKDFKCKCLTGFTGRFCELDVTIDG